MDEIATPEAAAPPTQSDVYVNRTSGARCRVVEVTESHALLVIDNPGVGEVKGSTTRYAMPIAEYDGDASIPPGRWFTSIWRPATAADIAGSPQPGFRPPANAAVTDPEPDGVVISADY